MYENAGDDQMLLEGPDQCWWCKGQLSERKMYPEMPEAIDLNGIVFAGVKHTLAEYDDDPVPVCHRCMALFYKWSEVNRRETAALGV